MISSGPKVGVGAGAGAGVGAGAGLAAAAGVGAGSGSVADRAGPVSARTAARMAGAKTAAERRQRDDRPIIEDPPGCGPGGIMTVFAETAMSRRQSSRRGRHGLAMRVVSGCRAASRWWWSA
ncbi:hypothetical protein C2U72_26495 [Prosthecomicrobium hirschii]|nr:hypothetical protein C2U72_26495 [Prosthecomicrobium hirschii]